MAAHWKNKSRPYEYADLKDLLKEVTARGWTVSISTSLKARKPSKPRKKPAAL